MPRKNPSTRWFFDDWHNDEGLQLCGLAARGAWIELLGICQANDGYLLINGKPPSIAALARYVRAPRMAFVRALTELENHGVFSRAENGIIFNRRMVRSRAHDARIARAQEAFILHSSPPKSPQGGLGKNGAGKKAEPSYGPPQDPIEIARKLGLPK